MSIVESTEIRFDPAETPTSPNFFKHNFLIVNSRQIAARLAERFFRENPGGVRISDHDQILKDNLQSPPQVKAETSLSSQETFAFDLARERELIQLYGEAYWPNFRTNFQTFINERYGHLKKTEYTMELSQNDQGQWEIYLERAGTLVKAKESFNIEALDLTLPDWYRYRCARDVVWATTTEEILNKEGHNLLFLVECSHAPFHIPEADREALGFGRQSFLRIHQFEPNLWEKGRARLKSTTIRHYLALGEQQEIYNLLTGVEVEGQSLLGLSHRLNSGLSIGLIEQEIDRLYDQTPLERKIIPKPEDQIQLTSEQTQAYFNQTENWLRGIFLMMKDRHFTNDEIANEFKALKLTLKEVIYGKGVDLTWIRDHSPEEFLRGIHKNLKQVQDKKNAQDDESASDCPGKTGFRKKDVSQMSPASQKAYWASPASDREHFWDNCPVCGRENINAVVKIGQRYPCCKETRTC